MTISNGDVIATSEADSNQLTDILFAPSHCFSALLKACKDPEYQDSWLSEFADRIIQYMRFVGQTSAEVPMVYGEIRVTEAETHTVLLHATFYWGHDENAFSSHGYPLPTEDFVPFLRDDQAAPLLRIRSLSLDQEYFALYAHEGAFGQEHALIDVKCTPVEACALERR